MFLSQFALQSAYPVCTHASPAEASGSKRLPFTQRITLLAFCLCFFFYQLTLWPSVREHNRRQFVKFNYVLKLDWSEAVVSLPGVALLVGRVSSPFCIREQRLSSKKSLSLLGWHRLTHNWHLWKGTDSYAAYFQVKKTALSVEAPRVYVDFCLYDARHGKIFWDSKGVSVHSIKIHDL